MGPYDHAFGADEGNAQASENARHDQNYEEEQQERA
jgi:hypothetical protein